MPATAPRSEVEHIGHFPGGLCGVALDGVGERVHAGGGGQALGHGGHHFGIDDGDDGHIVRIDADELALVLHVGDDVVDGHLGGRAGGGGNGDDRHAGVLGGRDALQTAHVGVLGVVDDDADGLGGVDGRAAADGDDVVRARGLEGGHAGLNVFNGGVGLDVGEQLVAQAVPVQNIGHLGGDAVAQQRGAGADQRLLEAAALGLGGHLGDGARAVIGCLIEHDAIGHDESLLECDED